MANAKSFHEDYSESDLDNDDTGPFLEVHHDLGRKWPLVAVYSSSPGLPFRQQLQTTVVDINNNDKVRIYGISHWPVHVRVVA